MCPYRGFVCLPSGLRWSHLSNPDVSFILARPSITVPVSFRSALPRGERHGAEAECPCEECVSIRAPARGATPCWRGALDVARSFDPRSRAGSDQNTPTLGSMTPVSIRAPARGATNCQTRKADCARVSIRAPARGATHSRREHRGGLNSFDPRSRAGSDGCTVWMPSRRMCFDPRSRAGSDLPVFSSGDVSL